MLPKKLKRLLNTPISYFRPLWDVLYYSVTSVAEKPSADVCFVINPGRSGSEYLSSLFRDDNDMVALHEARPQFTGAG